MVADGDEVVGIALLQQFKCDEAACAPSAPCAGVLLHQSALLGHGVEHLYWGHGLGSLIHVVLSVHLHHAHREVVGSGLADSGQCEAGVGVQAELSLHLAGNILCVSLSVELVLHVHGLYASGSVVDELLSDSNLVADLRIDIVAGHRSCGVVDDVGTTDGHVNDGRHTCILAQVLPLQQIAAHVDIHTALLHLVNDGYRSAISATSFIDGHGIAYIDTLGGNEVGLGQGDGTASGLGGGYVDAHQIGYVHVVLHTQLARQPHLVATGTRSLFHLEGNLVNVAASDGIILQVYGHVVGLRCPVAKRGTVFVTRIGTQGDAASLVGGVDVGIFGRGSLGLYVGEEGWHVVPCYL